jgi:hypothetical protein
LDDLWKHHRYAIHEESVEDGPVLLIKGTPKEDKVDTGSIISVAYQIATIAVSLALLFSVQRFMSEPIEGEEEKRAIMEQARTLKREARQRSLEILKASSELDIPLSTAFSINENDEQVRASRTTRERLSRKEELQSSVMELSGKRVVARGETRSSWGTAGSCG